MHRNHIICLMTLLSWISPTISLGTETDAKLKSFSLHHLEQRLAAIDSDLKQLAHYSLRSGVGAIGYRSKGGEASERKEWIEVELGQETPIDEIVLVPTIWRDTEKGFQADGFPLEFRVVAGTASNRTGSVICENPQIAPLLPRIAPLVIPIAETTASWLRIEATSLSPRAVDGLYAFQLAEFLVFNGPENVGLRCPVKASSITPDVPGAWDPNFLVDGFMPYLMDSAEGSQSLAYVSTFVEKPTLTLDLGQPYPLSRVHLHAVDQSDTVPQAHAGDLGIPRHLRIEGAIRPDFSDAATLLDFRRKTIYETGPIMMWRIPERTCRFVRLVAEDPGNPSESNPNRFRYGFAEIELFSKATNVALHKTAQASTAMRYPNRSLTALTDGNNLYGRILPIRDWLEQLARRHDLEAEQPALEAELSHRYARQKIYLKSLGWLAAMLAVSTVIILLVDRIVKQHAIHRTRERIAADLHDELGANLHAIGLLSDLTQNAKGSPEKLDRLLQRLRSLTERTGAAARYCTNILEAKGLYENLAEDMRRTSARLMADLEHTITIEGEEQVQHIKPRRRVDLFLFYKECLTNVLRHSNATQVTTTLIARPGLITLTVADNGQGLGETTGNGVPRSLKRRARFLGAQVSAGPSAEGGACITLKLKP